MKLLHLAATPYWCPALLCIHDGVQGDVTYCVGVLPAAIAIVCDLTPLSLAQALCFHWPTRSRHRVCLALCAFSSHMTLGTEQMLACAGGHSGRGRGSHR